MPIGIIGYPNLNDGWMDGWMDDRRRETERGGRRERRERIYFHHY